MAIVYPNVGRVYAAQLVTKKATPEDLILRLFKNNVSPAVGSVLADFTEATFSGYSLVTLTPANWSETSATVVRSDYAPAVEFTSDAGSQNEDIYGYYIATVTSGILVAVERFTNAPFNVADLGDKITVPPVMLFASSAG